eukprot:932440-Prymnesium_polylepis.1
MSPEAVSGRYARPAVPLAREVIRYELVAQLEVKLPVERDQRGTDRGDVGASVRAECPTGPLLFGSLRRPGV